MLWRRFGLVGGLCLLLLWPLAAAAQVEPPATPTPQPTTAAAEPPPPAPTAEPSREPRAPLTHTISEGETLVYLAELYGTTVEAIQLANSISDPALIFAGQEITIPGEAGAEVPTVYSVQLGDTLPGIAARFSTTVEAVAATADLVNGDSLYVGQRLPLISRSGSPNPLTISGRPHVVRSGETILSVAAIYQISPAALMSLNNLTYPARLYPGQRLRLPAEEPFQYLPDEWVRVNLRPEAIGQGDTAVLTVAHLDSGRPLGELIPPEGNPIPLRFSPTAGGGFIALVGFDAFAPPGRYTLQLSGEGAARPWPAFAQDFIVRATDFGLQAITIDDSQAALLDPTLRAAEDAFLDGIFTASGPDPLWDGPFQQPVTNAIVTAGYGAARSYNGGPVTVFHTGIDFAGQVGTPILSPANGVVVYTGTLELRGSTVIIDHGLGVMTAYYHLSRIDVQEGDRVAAGQPVAAGGNTGLSTGPHLHWDLRVWGAAVRPEPWLTRTP